MAVRLLFPNYVFQYNLLETGHVTQNYLDLLVQDVEGQRKKDPVGRRISNAYSGWQSYDGTERRHVFGKLVRIINEIHNGEFSQFFDHQGVSFKMGNMWTNINDNGAWNRPHLHNGCYYSGVFYIKADGDEGDFCAIDKDCQVVADFPPSVRSPNSWNFSPTSGSLLLFPSGLMHMVEPNTTDKDRISVSWNMTHEFNAQKQGFGWYPHTRDRKEWAHSQDELVFNLDENGKLVR